MLGTANTVSHLWYLQSERTILKLTELQICLKLKEKPKYFHTKCFTTNWATVCYPLQVVQAKANKDCIQQQIF